MRKKLILPPALPRGLFGIAVSLIWLWVIYLSGPVSLNETSVYTDSFENCQWNDQDNDFEIFLAGNQKFVIDYGSPGDFAKEVKPGDTVSLRAYDHDMIVSLSANGRSYMSYQSYYDARLKNCLAGATVPAIMFLVSIFSIILPPFLKKKPILALRAIESDDAHPHRLIGFDDYDDAEIPPPQDKAVWEKALAMGITLEPNPEMIVNTKELIVMITRFCTKNPRATISAAYQFSRAHNIPYQYYDTEHVKFIIPLHKKRVLEMLWSIKTGSSIHGKSPDSDVCAWATENRIIPVDFDGLDLCTQEEAAAMIFRCWPGEAES